MMLEQLFTSIDKNEIEHHTIYKINEWVHIDLNG